MATLTGGLSPSPYVTKIGDTQHLAALTITDIDYPYGESIVSHDLCSGTYSFGSPAYIPRTTVVGGIDHTYLYDFYFRFHLSFYSLNLGNVLAPQIYNLYIWNAWFDSVDFNTLTSVTLDGITLNLIHNPGSTFKPLESTLNILTASEVGSSNISGHLTFSFTTEDINLYIYGQRGVLWPFSPLRDFTESRQWLTDIVPSRNKEQRFVRRSIPRKQLNYSYSFRTDHEYSLAKAMANKAVESVIGLPSWAEATLLYDVNAGNTSVYFDTTKTEYMVGSPIVFWKDYKTFELKTISAITSTSISFTPEINNSFTSCYAMPVNIGYPNDGIKLQISDGRKMSGVLSQLSSDVYYNSVTPTAETYLGLPVITYQPFVTGGINDNFDREMAVVDFGQGDFIKFNIDNYSRAERSLRLVAKTQTELYNIRRFIDYFQGKYRAAWFPTFFYDLKPFDTSLISGASYIKVYSGLWVTYNFKHIRISGDREVDVAVDHVINNLDGTENVYFAPAIDSNLSNIRRISVLQKLRFNTDNIEFSFTGKGMVSVNIPLIEVNE